MAKNIGRCMCMLTIILVDIIVDSFSWNLLFPFPLSIIIMYKYSFPEERQ